MSTNEYFDYLFGKKETDNITVTAGKKTVVTERINLRRDARSKIIRTKSPEKPRESIPVEFPRNGNDDDDTENRMVKTHHTHDGEMKKRGPQKLIEVKRRDPMENDEKVFISGTQKRNLDFYENLDKDVIESMYIEGNNEILMEIFENNLEANKKLENMDQKTLNIFCRVFIRSGNIHKLLKILYPRRKENLKKIFALVTVVYWAIDFHICFDQDSLFDVIVDFANSVKYSDIGQDLIEVIRFNSDFDLSKRNFKCVREICREVWYREKLQDYLKFYDDYLGRELTRKQVLDKIKPHEIANLPYFIVMELHNHSKNPMILGTIEELHWFKKPQTWKPQVVPSVMPSRAMFDTYDDWETGEIEITNSIGYEKYILNGEIDRVLRSLSNEELEMKIPGIIATYMRVVAPVCRNQDSFFDLVLRKFPEIDRHHKDLIELLKYNIDMNISLENYQKLLELTKTGTFFATDIKKITDLCEAIVNGEKTLSELSPLIFTKNLFRFVPYAILNDLKDEAKKLRKTDEMAEIFLDAVDALR